MDDRLYLLCHTNDEGKVLCMNEFGKRLAHWRKEKGMTQLQVAQALHVSDSAVSRWESGESYPDITLLVPLADLLGRSLDDLLRDQPKYRDIHKKDVEEWLPFVISLAAIIVYYLFQKIGVTIIVCVLVYIIMMKACMTLFRQYTDRQKERTLCLMNSLFHFLVMANCSFQLIMTIQISRMMGVSMFSSMTFNDPFDAYGMSDPLRDAYLLSIVLGAIASVVIYHKTYSGGKFYKDKQSKQTSKELD